MLILSCALFYVAATITFPTSFINVAALVSAIFFLIQGCGLIDKEHKFGRYADENNAENNGSGQPPTAKK